jgi:hypothetical protein
MFVSKFVRSSTAAVVLLAVGLAACSEGPTAPGAGPSSFEPSAPLMDKGGNSNSNGNGNGAQAESPGRGKNSGTRTFTVLPGVASFEKFGDHVLVIPANAVCDPGKSKYGAAYWDTPCDPIRHPVQVTATWTTTRNGLAVISFSPDLRFAPSDNERNWVKLWLRDPRNINPELYYSILWFDREAKVWVDESVADPTLKAHLEFGNLVSRRLKHFSDYALWSGIGSYNVTSGMGGEIGLGAW